MSVPPLSSAFCFIQNNVVWLSLCVPFSRFCACVSPTCWASDVLNRAGHFRNFLLFSIKNYLFAFLSSLWPISAPILFKKPAPSQLDKKCKKSFIIIIEKVKKYRKSPALDFWINWKRISRSRRVFLNTCWKLCNRKVNTEKPLLLQKLVFPWKLLADDSQVEILQYKRIDRGKGHNLALVNK